MNIQSIVLILFQYFIIFFQQCLCYTVANGNGQSVVQGSPSNDLNVKINGKTIGQVEIKLVECSNDSVMQDFGVACLKQAINKSSPTDLLLGNDKPTHQIATNPQPNNSHKTRYFSVKPMVEKTNTVFQSYKSPAITARKLYENKGFNYPLKSVQSVSGSRVVPLSPSKYYSKFSAPDVVENIEPTDLLEQDKMTGEDEWNNVDLIDAPLSSLDAEKTSKLPSKEFEEELELLQSLKLSLGVLSAQAMNLKQRSAILYRESRKRKLYFFDRLLSRTHSFISDKLEETRNAIKDIDASIMEIRQHQQINSFNNLRKTLYGSNITKKSIRISQKDIDELMLDALNHAKRMMTIIKELNQALDEFEDQFNLPRFEPNSIDETREDF